MACGRFGVFGGCGVDATDNAKAAVPKLARSSPGEFVTVPVGSKRHGSRYWGKRPVQPT
jgi:hypothetical protein